MELLSVSGTGITQTALDTVLATWGVPGVVAVLAVGIVIWWTRATSGLRSEQEATISRLDKRASELVTERDNAIRDRDGWQESYYAVKYPQSGHHDVVSGTGLMEDE